MKGSELLLWVVVRVHALLPEHGQTYLQPRLHQSVLFDQQREHLAVLPVQRQIRHVEQRHHRIHVAARRRRSRTVIAIAASSGTGEQQSAAGAAAAPTGSVRDAREQREEL